MKVELDKLDINELVNVPTSLNNLKSWLDDLHVGKLEIAPRGLKKLSDVVANKVVKNTSFNTIKTKVNRLERKFVLQLH